MTVIPSFCMNFYIQRRVPETEASVANADSDSLKAIFALTIGTAFFLHFFLRQIQSTPSPLINQTIARVSLSTSSSPPGQMLLSHQLPRIAPILYSFNASRNWFGVPLAFQFKNHSRFFPMGGMSAATFLNVECSK